MTQYVKLRSQEKLFVESGVTESKKATGQPRVIKKVTIAREDDLDEVCTRRSCRD